MATQAWWQQARRLPGSPTAALLPVTAPEWSSAARDIATAGGRLLALWATPAPRAAAGGVVRAALLSEGRLLVLELAVDAAAGAYPGLESTFPAASRMQRAAFDLCGLRADDPDQRPWLRHAAWPAGSHPLRAAPPAGDADAVPVDDYPFVRVEGEGVHEVPVGPVHAGIIEPGHFRFSLVGEKILRLEARLGYVHKGIEVRFSQLRLSEGQRLAARVSGDSAVAFSWAYCQALEGLAQLAVPARAAWLRALALEIERIQNHLGDLGALGNDTGFAFALAQFSTLKEELLRTVHSSMGQRYLFDFVVPGGVAADLDAAGATALARRVRDVAASARELRLIYAEHAGVRDRFVGTGRVTPELAARLGLLGLAGRASGQRQDLRLDAPWDPYRELPPLRCGHTDGDVAARVAVRFDELQAACELIGRLLERLPDGPVRVAPPDDIAAGLAVGLIEGWRGPVMVALESDGRGGIARCHPHDSSWQGWPVLEHAVIGNILPDFPLINKSFNFTYSGHDI